MNKNGAKLVTVILLVLLITLWLSSLTVFAGMAWAG
jgi:hypothetical protein